MHRSVRAAGPIRLLIGSSLAATLLVGCGSGSSDPATPEPADASSPQVSSTTNAPVIEAATLAVPPGGPTTITEFPIPSGTRIVDIGPPFGGNWQFGISAPDTATTLEFYKKTLAAQGYTLEENASVKVGVNTVVYDLAFFGTAYGIVDENELLGGTLVTVDDSPLTGLEP
jgi:hypothetical protein